MLPLVAGVALTQVSDSETAERARQTIVRVVDFEQVDVRDAIRRLLRASLFGGTIAPDVQGTVTVRLRDVSLETALQSLTRQVDATYRIDHGFFEIVRRSDTIDLTSLRIVGSPENGVDEGYERIRRAVAAGRGKDLRRVLAGGFVLVNPNGAKKGEAAVRGLVDAERAYPYFQVLGDDLRRRAREASEKLVSYWRPETPAVYYRDLWIYADGQYRLARREETVRTGSRHFQNERLSEIARVLGEEVGVTFEVEPSVDRRVTVDLGNGPFETFLQRLCRQSGATYRMQGGVYRIVPREE